VHVQHTQDTEFWAAWNDFEVAHGNEDTFREMLRIKRSVSASYSQTHFNTAVGSGMPTAGTAAAASSAAPSGGKRARDGGLADDMQALEAEAVSHPTCFCPFSTHAQLLSRAHTHTHTLLPKPQTPNPNNASHVSPKALSLSHMTVLVKHGPFARDRRLTWPLFSVRFCSLTCSWGPCLTKTVMPQYLSTSIPHDLTLTAPTLTCSVCRRRRRR